jgi:hypothetical protein
MKTESFELPVRLLSVDEFAARFPQYGQFARTDGQFLFELLMSPASYDQARVATSHLDLPAVAGVAKICYQAVQAQTVVEWRGFLKQFIGAVVCALMEANGFEKTGTKKAVPHPAFTKGEFYCVTDTVSTQT